MTRYTLCDNDSSNYGIISLDNISIGYVYYIQFLFTTYQNFHDLLHLLLSITSYSGVFYELTQTSNKHQ